MSGKNKSYTSAHWKATQVLVLVYSEHFTDDCFEAASLPWCSVWDEKRRSGAILTIFLRHACHSKIDLLIEREAVKCSIEKRQVESAINFRANQ